MSDSEDESRDHNLKIVIIGDGSSGKVSYLLKNKFTIQKLIFII